jgi:hypothetical protein
MEDQIHDIPQVSDEENKILIADFTENEVRGVVFQMEHNKAPGPDGFPAEFYQVFWGVIKGDLLAMFHDFHKDTLDLFSLNFGIITLIPKIENATKIQQYRPICVLNVSFKIFTKVGTNRLNKVARTVVSPTQAGISWKVLLFYTGPSMNFIPKNLMELFLRLILKRPMIRLSGHSSSRLYT